MFRSIRIMSNEEFDKNLRQFRSQLMTPGISATAAVDRAVGWYCGGYARDMAFTARQIERVVNAIREDINGIPHD